MQEHVDSLALKAAADRLLSAAMDYWAEYRKTLGGAAVVWVEDEVGRLVLLTRGEYRDTLMANIPLCKGPIFFGAGADGEG